MIVLLADVPYACPAEYRRMAPQTFCLVTGIIAAWLIFSRFLSDKNYLVFKKKSAFEHPSCDDTGRSLGVTWTVVENRPGTRSPRQPATESSNDTSDNVEKNSFLYS